MNRSSLAWPLAGGPRRAPPVRLSRRVCSRIRAFKHRDGDADDMDSREMRPAGPPLEKKRDAAGLQDLCAVRGAPGTRNAFRSWPGQEQRARRTGDHARPGWDQDGRGVSPLAVPEMPAHGPRLDQQPHPPGVHDLQKVRPAPPVLNVVAATRTRRRAEQAHPIADQRISALDVVEPDWQATARTPRDQQNNGHERQPQQKMRAEGHDAPVPGNEHGPEQEDRASDAAEEVARCRSHDL